MIDKVKLLARDVRPRIERNSNLRQDADTIEQMMNIAGEALSVHLFPGGSPESGWRFRGPDIDRLLAEFESRPGFKAPTSAPASADRSEWSQEQFRSLTPLDRLKLANRGVSRDKDGTVHVVFDADKHR